MPEQLSLIRQLEMGWQRDAGDISFFCAAPDGGCARAMVVGRPDVPGGGLPSGFEESWHDATCNVCEFLVLRASEEVTEEGA